ncbi:hypothetical protein DFS33DRAFT_1276958 [Desarmillaria ectypa]|nr:hypothetical protein DFS33DRAFT_1276958 [Desarmillaria ectypa]
MTVNSQYGRLTWVEKLSLFAVLTSLVFYLCGKSLTLLFSFRRSKTLKVLPAPSASRFLMNYVSSNTCHREIWTNTSWAKERGLLIEVEELPERIASLMWIGKYQTGNVIFYCHGGGYVLPSSPGTFDFCLYVRQQLETRGIHTNIALLTYNLIPDVKFPSLLREAVSTIHHFLKGGIKSGNIILVGESAGGNLIRQILSHMLHPLSSINPLPPSLPFRSACLTCHPGFPSAAQADDLKDDLSVRTLREWGQLIIKDVPHTSEDMACVEPAGAPRRWFKNVETVVGGVLMLSSEVECMAGAHRFFYEEH